MPKTKGPKPIEVKQRILIFAGRGVDNGEISISVDVPDLIDLTKIALTGGERRKIEAAYRSWLTQHVELIMTQVCIDLYVSAFEECTALLSEARGGEYSPIPKSGTNLGEMYGKLLRKFQRKARAGRKRELDANMLDGDKAKFLIVQKMLMDWQPTPNSNLTYPPKISVSKKLFPANADPRRQFNRYLDKFCLTYPDSFSS